ncbi:MAG: DUF3617 domain-containing protein [Candidatus Binataceae bacterium]
MLKLSNRVGAILVIGVLIGFAAGPVNAGDFQAGKWQFNVRMDLAKMHFTPGIKLPPGVFLPGQPGAPQLHDTCLTPDRMVPGPAMLGACTFDKITHTGNVVTWSVTCHSPEGQVWDGGVARYTGTAMKGKMRIRSTDAAGKATLDVTENLTGKYLGPCD